MNDRFDPLFDDEEHPDDSSDDLDEILNHGSEPESDDTLDDMERVLDEDLGLDDEAPDGDKHSHAYFEGGRLILGDDFDEDDLLNLDDEAPEDDDLANAFKDPDESHFDDGMQRIFDEDLRLSDEEEEKRADADAMPLLSYGEGDNDEFEEFHLTPIPHSGESNIDNVLGTRNEVQMSDLRFQPLKSLSKVKSAILSNAPRRSLLEVLRGVPKKSEPAPKFPEIRDRYSDIIRVLAHQVVGTQRRHPASIEAPLEKVFRVPGGLISVSVSQEDVLTSLDEYQDIAPSGAHVTYAAVDNADANSLPAPAEVRIMPNRLHVSVAQASNSSRLSMRISLSGIEGLREETVRISQFDTSNNFYSHATVSHRMREYFNTVILGLCEAMDEQVIQQSNAILSEMQKQHAPLLGSEKQ